MSDELDAGRPALPQAIALLRAAAAAHGAYETDALDGRRDEEWPAWYATYLRDHEFPDLLAEAGHPVPPPLEQWLAEADLRYRVEAPAMPWEEYYARYFLGLI